MSLLQGLNREHGVALVVITHDPTSPTGPPARISIRDGLIEHRDRRMRLGEALASPGRRSSPTGCGPS
jgi:ABC-type lipoprotein export system ATPase subunit